MSFNSAIPQSGDPRAQSQMQLLSNFETIATVFAGNHTSLTGTNPPGQHRSLTFRPQIDDPVTAATQVALYNKLVSTIPQLFFRPASNGTPIQLTYVPPVSTGTQQYSVIAGPFIIYCGYYLNGITSGVVKTLSPASTLLYVGLTTSGAVKTLQDSSAVATDLNVPASSFRIKFQAGVTFPNNMSAVYYLAIGKP